MLKQPSIIIDNGTFSFKVGIAGQEVPLVIPTRKERLNLDYDWDEIKKTWDCIFLKQLKVLPEEHNVMLTEPPMNSMENRKEMAQIMFENLNVQGLDIVDQSVLSLYSASKVIGIVCDSGHCVSHFVPSFEGYALPNSYLKMNLAGKAITDFLISQLDLHSFSFSTLSVERAYAEGIKEKNCYVALDSEKEMKNFKEQCLEMPDGTIIKIKDLRFRAPEILFQYFEMSVRKEEGFSQKCNNAINKSDRQLIKELYQNIVLSGGTTMFPGFQDRITQDIQALAPENMKNKVKVIANPKKLFATWVGGSILSSISKSLARGITKEDWKEYGDAIIWKKYH